MPPAELGWIRAELDAIRATVDAVAKGKRLERLVRNILCRIPGLTIEDQDVVNAYATQEMDLYFFNAREREGLHFLDCPLIVECKGWSGPVDGRELRHFATLLKDRGRRSGIFVALSGITGDARSRSAGFYHVTAALAGGQLVLVVTGEDLEAAEDPAHLVALLRRRMLDQVRGQILALERSARKGRAGRKGGTPRRATRKGHHGGGRE